MSQFDDLLADLGPTDSAPLKATNNGTTDDFDPFGGSFQTTNTTNGGDSGLLLDFTMTSEVTNGNATVADSANPLYDMSADTSSNPLYDMTSSGNPLYDLQQAEVAMDVNQSANPLYDLAATESQPANPLYDLENNGFTEDTSAPTDTAPTSLDLIGDIATSDPVVPEEDTQATEQLVDDSAYHSNVVTEEASFSEEVHVTQPCEASDDGDDLAHEDLPDLVVTEEGDETPVAGAKPTEYGHDRREQDLETYCVDRDEESDVMLDRDDPQQPEVDQVLDDLHVEEVGDAPSEQVVEDEALAEAEEPVQNGVSEPENNSLDEQFADSGLESTQITSQSITSDQWVSQNEVDTEETSKSEVQEINTIPDPTPSEPIVEMDRIQENPVAPESPVNETPAPTQLDFQQEILSAEGGVYENEPQQFEQWQNEEEEEEGVYESVPVKRDDVVREADRDITADLPAIGTASSLKAKWASGQIENEEVPRPKRALTPPIHGTGGEYVSEPRTYVEKYEGKAEAGVFESDPQSNPDVVNSSSAQEEVLPEQGFTKNVAARFKELEKSQGEYVSPNKREVTPDRSGKAEYVSEPRASELINEEQVPESGVFESQPQLNPDVVRSDEGLEEKLPEQGMAKNLASRFKQMSVDNSQYQSPRAKRELTPDASGQTEYVSEPRSTIEAYEAPKVDAGVFENTPTEDDPNVVKSDSLADEFVPERGFAKNVAARFKELENNAKSPTQSPGRRKELTPPREDVVGQSGVYESTPEVKADVVTSGSQIEEALPERGSARNMADRFRQMEHASRSPGSSGRQKEFTPPPGESGVFESTPKQFQADYNRPPESGIIENTPAVRDDVVKGDEPPKYEVELPERGFASKMLNQWKQKESESAKAKSPGSGGRIKEFTPPREEPRIGSYQRTPRTPLSPGGQMDNGSVHPSELPGQYQPQEVESVFESQPERNPDVVREDDTDWTAGMPKKGAANKMLAKFQKIQSESKNDENASPRRDSETESLEETYSESIQNENVQENETATETERTRLNGSLVTEEESDIRERESCEPEPPMENARLKFEDPEKVGRSKSMRAAIQLEKCGACEKTVYAMERLEMNKRVYHKACFRCNQCKSVLTPKTFAINNDVIFCTTHYKQLFTRKGNYDEGFGRVQHKKRWNSNPDLAGAGEGNESEAKS